MKRELSFKPQINLKQGTANQNKIKQNETKEDITMTFNINVKKLNENAILPTYGSEYAAGADLYACLEAPVTIEPGETVMIHTGLAM